MGGCFEYSSETTTIDVIINSNSNEKKRQSLCYLKPNTQYYVSVFVSTENSYTEYDGSGKLIKILLPTLGCNQAGWCGLSFFAN